MGGQIDLLQEIQEEPKDAKFCATDARSSFVHLTGISVFFESRNTCRLYFHKCVANMFTTKFKLSEHLAKCFNPNIVNNYSQRYEN